MANPVSTHRSAIVDRFLNELARQFGLPSRIVHDNSGEFLSIATLEALTQEQVGIVYGALPPRAGGDADVP